MVRAGLSITMSYVVLGVIVLSVVLVVAFGGQGSMKGLFSFVGSEATEAGEDLTTAQEGQTSDGAPSDGAEDGTGSGSGTEGPAEGEGATVTPQGGTYEAITE